MPGCAATRLDTVALAPDPHAMLAPSSCTPAFTALQRGATVGAVQQRGGQTRIVGVPRSFLIAMLVLIALVALV